MPVTKEQQKELARLARAANRRLERATEGQRAYLEYQIRKYHTRERESGMRVFQQGKASTTAEFNARMRELRRFMGYDDKQVRSSYRKGWEQMKAEQVAAGGAKLRGIKVNITDEELALILQELDAKNKDATLYDALVNVELAKEEAGDKWEPSQEAIQTALAEKRDDQEKTERLLRLREENKKNKKRG